MIVDCISDLHGHYPKLEGGDLLIVAGDLTANDTPDQFQDFFSWLSEQDYQSAVVIGGNHDNLLQKGCLPFLELDKPLDISIYCLCDSTIEVDGLKIWGSPWTTKFPGMNPHCMAFTVDTDEELEEKWKLIPDDIDILVTHSPPFGMLDTVDRMFGEYENVGSRSLGRFTIDHSHSIKLHVFGHIHSGYGIYDVPKAPTYLGDKNIPVFVNCSHVNEMYEPVNKPVRIIL